MANPSIGNITKAYVSAVDPIIDTREINKQIPDVYNEDMLSDILGFGGKKMPTKQPVYYTFYDDPLVKYITATTVTNSGTTTVTLLLTAATSGYSRIGDMVMSVTNTNVGIISSVSSSSGVDTVIVKSVSGANLTMTNAAGQNFSLFSRAQGENSTTPNNLRFGLTRQTNKYQIFRETSRITDVQNASTIEVTINGQPRWLLKDQWEKSILLKSQMNAALWGSDMSQTSYSDTNPFLTDGAASASGLAGAGAVQTTRGVNKYVELYGVSLVNGSLGTYVKANLDDLVTNLIAQRAPKRYLAISSSLAKTTIDTYLKSLGSSGVNSVRLVVGGKELDLEVDKLRYGGFELNYTVMNMLDHPVTFGYSSISKNIFYLPYENKVKVEGGGSDDQIRMRYIPRESVYGSDMISEIHYGALSPINPTGTDMYIGTDWTCKMGAEILAPQHLIKQQVLA
jgi:hypothetical protein